MELARSTDPFIPDLEYLLNSVQYMNPVKKSCKKENKLDDEIPNFSEAYLGPQIWNNTMGDDEMKLGQIDLEELMNENNLNKELDISLLSSPQESGSKNDIPDQNLGSNKEKEKTLEDQSPDFHAAYLGPQIWNNAQCIDGEMKLEQLDLEELLDDSDLNREVDITLLNLQQESGLKNDHVTHIGKESEDEQYALIDSRDKVHSPYLANSPQFTQFNNVSYNQQSPTHTIPMSPGLDVALPPVPLCELEQKSTDCLQFEADGMDTMSKEGDSDSESFDPCKRSFTDDELKPQPIIRKARKVHVPDDCKDEKYWQKRVKNNVAAKRSREARRIKENQIAMRTKFLEKENSNLHGEVKALRVELQRLMDIVAKYEK
uniref:hepatic leukemia factor-like isoform X1 n=1 Tax=Styela clava TaxID=7725 RepID=UPI00193A8F19|nr:hepatic leukemia factor-like isoform X1 [Styela clava]XP_039256593.1 hepatic leukemia factor-like isoform X1 [Styela clava]